MTRISAKRKLLWGNVWMCGLPYPHSGLISGLVLVLILGLGCQGQVGALGGGPSPSGGPIDSTGKVLTADQILAQNTRRLSREELDRTIGSLLHTNTQYATSLLPEDDHEREGLFLHWAFDNRYTHQPADKVLVQAYESLAHRAAVDLVADEERRRQVVSCVPSGPSDAECFETFLREFGRRAFRRPLTDADVARFMPLMSEAEEDGDFYSAVDVAIRAFLQSPDFLYRIEIGAPLAALDEVSRLNGFEIATRMSFFLWGSGPSDELLDLAESGALDSADGRRDVALTMLDEPEAIEQVERFHALWLGFRQLPHSVELTTAMRLETRALLERVIFEQEGSYMDVFRSRDTFVDDTLAAHYGMDLPGTATFVDYESELLAGILSHGSVMGAFSTGGDTSLTRRGVFVRERLMCEIIPPPPPTVNVDDRPEADCKSEDMELHQMGGCGGCHSLMDPVGWGLENFDLAGRYREHDDGKPECLVDGQGAINGEAFRGPRELSEILIETGSLEACAIRQVLRFAMGREERPEDEAFIDSLTEERVGTGWTYSDLLLDIVGDERFALVREDETEGR